VALIRAETPLSSYRQAGSPGSLPFQTSSRPAGLVTAAMPHTLYHMLLGGDLFGSCPEQSFGARRPPGQEGGLTAASASRRETEQCLP